MVSTWYILYFDQTGHINKDSFGYKVHKPIWTNWPTGEKDEFIIYERGKSPPVSAKQLVPGK